MPHISLKDGVARPSCWATRKQKEHTTPAPQGMHISSPVSLWAQHNHQRLPGTADPATL